MATTDQLTDALPSRPSSAARPRWIGALLRSRPRPANVLAIPVAIVAGILVVGPLPIPFGWVVVAGAVLVVPAAALGWMLGLARSWWLAAMLGLPAAFGLQLPAYVVAALLHLDPEVWAVAAIVIGLVPAVIARPTRSHEIADFRPSALVAVALVLVTLGGVGAVLISGRDSDDWTYAADIADTAAGLPLAASDSVLGSDVPMIPRERLDLWVGVLGVGLRASATSAPALLQDQLPPVIAVLSILAFYLLGAAVGGSPIWGVVAAFANLAWFAITPSWPLQGDAFLTRIGQDKIVAWVALMPLSLIPLVAMEAWSPRRALYALAILAGLGIAAIHPVTQAIESAVLVIWAVIALATKSPIRLRLLTSALLFACGIVVAALGLAAFVSLGPPAGTEAATRLATAMNSVTAAPFAFSRRIPPLILNPSLVRDTLAITMSLLAVGAFLVRRNAATTLAAALVVTTVLIGFNPLVTPLLARFLGDYLGVGLLLRVPWILPVGIALPALMVAWRERTRVELPYGPLIACAIVVGCALPLAPAAARQWLARAHQAWHEIPAATGISEAIAAESKVDDVVLAPKVVEFRVPAYDPRVRMVAYRGLVGTVPHFPTERTDEAVARADSVAAFYAKGRDRLTTDDVRTIVGFGVKYLVLNGADGRLPEVFADPGFTWMDTEQGYVLFRVSPENIRGGVDYGEIRDGG